MAALTQAQVDILYYRWGYNQYGTGYDLGLDGNGELNILAWHLPGVAPTHSEIDAAVTHPIYLENKADESRYSQPDGFKGSHKQLQLIYQDLRDNTTTWIDHMRYVYGKYSETGTPYTAPSIAAMTVDSKLPSQSASGKSIVSVSSSSSQSISGTSKVTVAMNSEAIDAASTYASNTFTAPSTGIYEVSAFLQVDNFAIISLLNAYKWELYFTQSGSASVSHLVDAYNHAILGAIPARLQGTKMISLTAGDTVVLQVQKSLSTALNVTTAYINIKKVSNA